MDVTFDVVKDLVVDDKIQINDQAFVVESGAVRQELPLADFTPTSHRLCISCMIIPCRS